MLVPLKKKNKTTTTTTKTTAGALKKNVYSLFPEIINHKDNKYLGDIGDF